MGVLDRHSFAFNNTETTSFKSNTKQNLMKPSILFPIYMLLMSISTFAQTTAGNYTYAINVKENVPVISANIEESHIELNWFTRKEVNASYFNILRSDNGGNFYIVGRVNASGSNAFENHYTYSEEIEFTTANTVFMVELIDMNGRHYASLEVTLIIPDDLAIEEFK